MTKPIHQVVLWLVAIGIVLISISVLLLALQPAGQLVLGDPVNQPNLTGRELLTGVWWLSWCLIALASVAGWWYGRKI
ncbi:MAG: hypothetical protein HYV33_01110 [Candidatus Kerfeldbacteria bacterium]|nr:hypothetical protein [Candidatus Kerfeldbacteria bacterium]